MVGKLQKNERELFRTRLEDLIDPMRVFKDELNACAFSRVLPLQLPHFASEVPNSHPISLPIETQLISLKQTIF